MSGLLPYERECLSDLLTDDALTIFGEGISHHHLLLSLLAAYSRPGVLVLVVECEEVLEGWLVERLVGSEDVLIHPRKITSEVGVGKREGCYMEGGVQFVSKRILVVDMLVGRIPVELITGLVFFNAHYISDTSIESFITRLFRTSNKEGFIKAFSSNPIQMSKFNQLEKAMRHLFLPKFYLWPRFHASISETIDLHKCEVIELHVPLTETMKNLQLCMVDVLKFCLKELKKQVPDLDPQFFEVERAVSRAYFRGLKKTLLPTWSHLSPNTKQLLEDIRTLSGLSNDLLGSSVVGFHEQVRRLRTAGGSSTRAAGGSSTRAVSMWMFTDGFEQLVSLSKARCEQLELSPKWEAMEEVLRETGNRDKESENSPTTIICVGSTSTARQLVRFIRDGEVKVLEEELSATQQSSTPGAADHEPEEDDTFGTELSHNIHFLIKPRNTCEIEEYLQALQPTHVILYEPDLFIIRTLEMFRCRRPGKPLRIYFLIYSSSIEEQQYLTALGEEKKAFEALIALKRDMVVHTDADGKQGTNPLLERGEQSLKFADLQDTRSQGTPCSYPKVIIDMRDLRSSLPSILHKRGLDVVPRTIEVGDYILTPDICVERKSIPDLIGSLSSGRLYQQCRSMCNSYKHPMLLIEFNETHGFSLQNYSEITDSVVTTSLQTQLTLLTLHFPQLTLLWSQSEYTTANLFAELKKGKDNPVCDAIDAVSKNTAIATAEFDSDTITTLLSLPGVTTRNYFLLARGFGNLLELSNASLGQISDVLGSKEQGKLLYNFLNMKHDVKQDSQTVVSAKTKYAKFKKFRKN